jgi:hypothetical protein
VDYFSISEWNLASGQAVVLELAGEACTLSCQLEYCCAMEMNPCLSTGSEDRNGVSANSYPGRKKNHVHTLVVLYAE